MRRPILLLCTALALCVACGKEGTPPDDTDAGPFDAGSIAADGGPTATVEIGTGQDSFIALTTGQLVSFEQGPQGGGACEGYHIWGAVRTKGFDPIDARVVFHDMDVATRTDFARQERVDELQPMGDKFFIAAFNARIFNCCEVLNSRFIMRVEVTDRFGVTGSDERELMLPSSCVDINSGQSVCPRTCP